MEDIERPMIGHSCRVLTEEEVDKLKRDCVFVPDFKQDKLEAEARKNWDKFYNRNSTNFFKDRHWTKREFADLDNLSDKDGERKVVLEVGCGVGNFIFPLIEEESNVFFYACDFSKRAVNFVKENPLYNTEYCKAFECDITQDDLTKEIPVNSVDIVTMIFVLSAVHPDKMKAALENILKILKPGGSILFRDYGLYDYAMLRFSSGHKLAENFYVRQDKTRAFYFSTDELFSCELLREKLTCGNKLVFVTGSEYIQQGYIADLLTNVGYEVISNNYVQRETVNKKEGICVPRIFVQGKFQKPGKSNAPSGPANAETGDSSTKNDDLSLPSAMEYLNLKNNQSDLTVDESSQNLECAAGNLSHTGESGVS